MQRSFINAPRLPLEPQVKCTREQQQLAFMSASILLDYPADDAAKRYAAVAEQAEELPAELAQPLQQFLDWARQLGVRKLREHFVETFDQRRRCALWLSYYAVGDTRQRGHAILSFAEVLNRCGWQVREGELADYLPVVLEFAARDESGSGVELLAAHRDGLEVLRGALTSCDSGYRHLLTVVCRALPDIDLEVVERYQQLVRRGPATELVGINPTSPLLAPYGANPGEDGAAVSHTALGSQR